MKTKRVLTLGALFLWGCLYGVATAAPPQSPDSFNLEELSGKVVLVDFWASWCGPCKESLPWLNQMQAKYGADGLQVVAVNLDRDLSRAEKMVGEFGEDILQIHDPLGNLAADRNLQGMPSAYLYDQDGQLAAVHVGFLASEKDLREQQLQRLLAGESLHFDTDQLAADVARVQPWARDLLAAPGMAIEGDLIETALDEHIYFSKEASSGGLGSAGGGCGCN